MLSKAELKEKLSQSVAKVIFNKSDGTLREMRCTLMSEFLPAKKELTEEVKPRKQNDDVVAVWDLDKESWRSFRLDSIVSFEGV